MLLITIFTSCIITTSTAAFCNNGASRTYQQQTTRIYSAPPRTRRQENDNNNNNSNNNDNENLNVFTKKSNESSFWYNVPNKEPLPQEEVIPYQSKLDDNGPLPYGSYKLLGKEEYESKRTCVLSVAFDFWNNNNNRGVGTSTSTSTSDQSSSSSSVIDSSHVLQNVHKLIDSGLTSFQLYNPIPPNNNNNNNSRQIMTMEPTKKQTFTEQNIYHKIIQETPTSILNQQCTFSTRIQIPSPSIIGSYENNYEDSSSSSSFVFKESLVRQHVGQSIMNMYGHANGCLDSVQVNFQYDNDNKSSNSSNNNDRNSNNNGNNSNMSPYTFDVLSVLQDMQREGLIRSISGLNFPSYAIDEVEKHGFELDYNQLTSNLLDPTRYTKDIQYANSNNYNNNNTKKKKNVVLSGALAGGLLTNRYSNIPRSYLNKYGEPMNGYMSPSELWHYKHSCSQSWAPYTRQRNLDRNRNNRSRFSSSRNTNTNTWQMFEKEVMKTLEGIAYKHQVSIASVILRWSIQLEQVGSVVVGSSFNTKYDADDRLYTRPRELRQVFSFMLDEEDMDQLWDVSGSDKVEHGGWGGMGEGDDMGQIDFSNTKLWL
jgi:hypothetical protein